MNINISIEKKYVFLICGLLILFGGMFTVNAFNANGVGGDPAIMGHSVDEIVGGGVGPQGEPGVGGDIEDVYRFGDMSRILHDGIETHKTKVYVADYGEIVYGPIRASVSWVFYIEAQSKIENDIIKTSIRFVKNPGRGGSSILCDSGWNNGDSDCSVYYSHHQYDFEVKATYNGLEVLDSSSDQVGVAHWKEEGVSSTCYCDVMHEWDTLTRIWGPYGTLCERDANSQEKYYTGGC